ncbi:MAG: cytochrome c [Actinobacteria bacterium]|nr:cytochrome c [Actinomycetota bacterium]
MWEGSDVRLLGCEHSMVLRSLLAALVTTFAVTAPASAQQSGKELYDRRCASCHGPDGAGREELGPSLMQAGAAAADYQLRTGRMPLQNPQAQAVRKPPVFSEEEIRLLVTYVASLGEGPGIPSVDPEAGDLSSGQSLFITNCAACHGAGGNGGAVGNNAAAPSLYASETVTMAEAMVTGPGQMPVFGFSEQERNDIIAFISHLQTSEAPGGIDIGGTGPVPEGFVAWFFGLTGLVMVLVLLVGAGSSRESR